MSCDNYPSKKDVEDFALNARVINEITTSNTDLTPTHASDGMQKKTIASIINSYKGDYRGGYLAGVVYSQYNQYYSYKISDEVQQWSVKLGVELPYTSTEVNPALDDNLVRFSGENYQQKELTLTFSNIEKLKSGELSNGELVNLSLLNSGLRVDWLGYFDASDGGGNWGILKKGSHTEDFGSIISINADTFIECNIKGAVNIAKFGCVGQLDDVTDRFQNALNAVDGDITSLANITHTTSKTLFNQKENRTVNLNWSKIKNSTNSMYGIVSVSKSLTTQTDTALNALMAEEHFSNQLDNANIVNVIVEMQKNTSSGNNLGVGLVYCKNSTLTANIISSNGNGAEIRCSLNCMVDVNVSGHRNYGVFNYMSKYSNIKAVVDGGTRSLIIKHAYFNDPDIDCAVDLIAKNATQRCIGGGSSAGTGASAALEPSGHEIVRGVIVKRAILTADSSCEVAPQIAIGRHADKWTFKDITIQNKSTSKNTYNVNIGGEGTDGYFIGGNHLIDNLKIYDAKADAVPVISCAVSTKITNTYIHGKYHSAINFNNINASDKSAFIVDNVKLNGEFINNAAGDGIVKINSSINNYIENDLSIIGKSAENVNFTTRKRLSLITSQAEINRQTNQTVTIEAAEDSATTELFVNTILPCNYHLLISANINIENNASTLASVQAVNTTALAHQITLNNFAMTDNYNAATTAIRHSNTGTPSSNSFSGFDTDSVAII